MRAVAVTAGILAIATVLAEVLALGLLWSEGRLNNDAVREIREILREQPGSYQEEPVASSGQAVSIEDVIDARTIRILQLQEREQEQQLLQAFVADSRAAVLRDQQSLTTERAAFTQQQADQLKKEQSAAVEQARAVLLKADVVTALAQLMELSTDECVTLMKGMPEKKIAELLGAFAAGDKAQATRGQDIFQSIARSRENVPADGADEKGTP